MKDKYGNKEMIKDLSSSQKEGWAIEELLCFERKRNFDLIHKTVLRPYENIRFKEYYPSEEI